MLSCDLQSLMLLPRLTEGSDDGAIFSNKVFLIKVHGLFFFKCAYGLLSEKAMAPHSSTLAWKIPWMEKPGRLQSMGSLRVGHD